MSRPFQTGGTICRPATLYWCCPATTWPHRTACRDRRRPRRARWPPTNRRRSRLTGTRIRRALLEQEHIQSAQKAACWSGNVESRSTTCWAQSDIILWLECAVYSSF